MKNPLIAERLKFYRKKNNLTIPEVSDLLSTAQPVAEKNNLRMGKRAYSTGCRHSDAPLLYLPRG